MSANKKTLNEISIAGLLGALIGLVVGMALMTEYGVKWFVLPTMSLVAMLMAGVCYRPIEVWKVVTSVLGWRRRVFSSVISNTVGGVDTVWSFLWAERSFDVMAVLRRHRVAIVHSVLAIAMTASFVVVSRYTVGEVMLILEVNNPEFSVWISGPVASVVMSLALFMPFSSLCGLAQEEWASWMMPIYGRVFARLAKWWNSPPKKKGEPWTIRNSLELWLLLVLFPPCVMLSLVFGTLVMDVDAILTIVLALASTERLASMLGGLIGVTCGYFCLMHYGWPHIVAIAVCGLAGVFSGRWLYVARKALTYIEPVPELA